MVELQAGGTSLYDSYGGSVHFYTSNYTGWLGVGYQNGFKLGAAVQTSFHQDSLRIGSSVLLQRYATDLFSIGINVLTQDIRYTWVRKRTVVMAAAGSAAAAYGSQFFQAYSFDAPFGALSARHQASRQVNLGFDGVIAGAADRHRQRGVLPQGQPRARRERRHRQQRSLRRGRPRVQDPHRRRAHLIRGNG